MMESSSEAINNFEEILKKNVQKKTISLYAHSNFKINDNQHQFWNPQSIICSVSSQLKAIQKADTVVNSNNIHTDILKQQKFGGTNFMSVNKLTLGDMPVPSSHKNKFETQFVLDTQLMDIIENAEDLVEANNCISQEFENTFHGSNMDSKSKLNGNKTLAFNISMTKGKNEIDYLVMSEKSANIIEHFDTNKKLEGCTDTCTNNLLIDYVDTEDSASALNDPIDDEDLPSSFIFKPFKKSCFSSPLVFDLNIFEDFEKIAMPIIKENTNLKSAKQLINSQLVGRELIIQSYGKPLPHKKHVPLSPVLKVAMDKFKEVDTEDASNCFTNNNKSDHVPFKKLKEDSVFLREEIIFSSDEESDRQLQDLPLTCALETSFYNQSQILDKTIYVGFQTASNRPIQVCSDSYEKARSLLDICDEDEYTTNGVTITELVNMCEKETSKHVTKSFRETNLEIGQGNHKINNDDQKDNENCFDSLDLKNSNSKFVEKFISRKSIKEPVKRKAKEYETSYYKKNKLSEIALAKSEQLLQNTNQNNNDDSKRTLIESYKSSTKSEIDSLLDTTHIDEDLINEFAHDMPLIEINNASDNLDTSSKTSDMKDNNISEALLAKTKKICDDIDITKKNNDINNSPLGNIDKDNENKDIVDTNVLTNIVDLKVNSNKNFNLSMKALAETKCVLKETREIVPSIDCIDIVISERLHQQCLHWDQPSTSLLHNCRFKTASNKEIKISLDSLTKSKTVLQDIIDENAVIDVKSSRAIKKSYNMNQNQPSLHNFIGFRTANNKKINISEEAYSKTKNMFKNIDMFNEEPTKVEAENFKDLEFTSEGDEIQIVHKKHTMCKDGSPEFNAPLSNKNTTFCEFKTASNKPVKVSEKAFVLSQKLLTDLDNNDFNLSYDRKITSHENISSTKNSKINNEDFAMANFCSYKTASNEPVNLSESAFVESKKLLSALHLIDFNLNEKNVVTKSNYYCDTNSPTLNTMNRKDSMNLQNDSTAFVGFRRASNKEIKITPKALAHSKKLFSDLEFDSLFNDCNETNLTLQVVSNTKDDVYKQHIEKQTFDTVTRDKILCIENNVSHKGFQTASKKPIKISDKALAKSMKLLMDFEMANSNILNVNNSQKHIMQPEIQKSVGHIQTVRFQSSNEKSVEISSEALAENKPPLEAIANIIETEQGKSKLQAEFLNCNKEDVLSNDETVITSRKSSHCINRTKSYVSDARKKKPIEFCGFQTASKKKVLVSEQALQKSRQMFQDIEDDLEKAVNKPLYKIPVNYKESRTDKIPDTTSILKLGSNNNRETFENALVKSRRRFSNSISNGDNTDSLISNNDPNKSLERLIDTQVVNNFEKTLCTEDFCKISTPKNCKRSGSPILSCPKAKRGKKFETPYRKNVVPKININTKTEFVIDATSESDTLFNRDYKKLKRYSLEDLANVEKHVERPDMSTLSYISLFNFNTLLNFRFTGRRNDISDVHMSTEDVKNLFLRVVNKKLIPEGWLDNHIKLVIWKLLSYEIKFPNTLSGICTVKNLLDQLKYRYDRELYNAERPALRKILEKDDLASRSLVLCVAAIYVDGVSLSSVDKDVVNVELLLTDGWYCIKSTIDKMLTKLVYDKRITIGCKIITNGAELINCDQGVSPWEDTSSVRLKIFGNSTRLARWDARLGYHGSVAVLTHLSSVKVEGGKVSKLRLYVTRVYPPLFVEKFEDGSTVTRSERLESLHQLKFESERQSMIEKLYEEVEKELSNQESQDSDSNHNNNKKLRNGSQLLTSSQMRSIEECCSKRRERLIQNIEKKLQEKMKSRGISMNRNVIPLLKVRVAGFKKNSKEITRGLMSIWKPNDTIAEIIREGTWLEVLNVVPTAIRYGELQISVGRSTIFRDSIYSKNSEILPYTKSLKRKCYHIKELAKNPIITTDYNEVDTVGFIFQIDPPTSSFDYKKQPFQNIYLTDADKHIICVNFWGGLKKFGYHNVLDTGQVVACLNLQKRSGNTKKSIPHYRATEFSYFTKTPKNLDARDILKELENKISVLDRRKYCQECIILRNNCNKTLGFNNENISPYRFNNNHSLNKNKVFIDSPLANKPTDDNLNLSGLDFESTFKQTTQELSPHQLLRKKKVNEKIAKLKMYGEPPPLSHLNIINQSKNAFNSYKSPLASNDSVHKMVENNEKKESDIQTSPILSMNRTYVKKGNPVRLNFSNVQDDKLVKDVVDHFTEDFDSSPPLSLD